MKAEQQQHNWVFSPAFVYFLASFLLLGSIASLYAWLVFTPFARTPYGVPSLGCQEDNEGSWSIGLFYGSSPFTLLPIEDKNVWKNESSACPVANPVITCASVSEAGFPSNFVADPFLYIQLIWTYDTRKAIQNTSMLRGLERRNVNLEFQER